MVKSYQTGGHGAASRSAIAASLVFTGEFSMANATSRTRQRPDAAAFQAANPEPQRPQSGAALGPARFALGARRG
jgi:iron complex outermembrane receptor protein